MTNHLLHRTTWHNIDNTINIEGNNYQVKYQQLIDIAIAIISTINKFIQILDSDKQNEGVNEFIKYPLFQSIFTKLTQFIKQDYNMLFKNILMQRKKDEGGTMS